MEIYMFLIAFPFLCIVFVLLYLFFKKELKQPEHVQNMFQREIVYRCL